MSTIIRLKRSGNTVSPNKLASGEAAYSWESSTGGKLYLGWGDEIVAGEAPNIAVIGGKYFTDKLDHTPGALTANSAIITGTDNKIDLLNVDNITINGNTISSTDNNGSIILDPNGTGTVDISSARITSVGAPSANTDGVNKEYVDLAIAALEQNSNLDITGDAGSGTITFATEALNISGGTGLSSAVTDNTVTINLDNTGVTANTYGSTTAIPVLTINAQGQITVATTAAISTSFNLYGDTGVQDISGGGSYTISGGDGLSVNTGNSRIDITLDNTGVTANTYGSSTQIPVLTVNAQGQITAATLASIATTLKIAGDSGTDTVDLINDTFTIVGGTALTSAVANNQVTINLDNTTVVANTYGTASSVGTFTVDAQGRLTAATTTPILITAAQVSDFTESVQDVVGAFTSGDAGQGITVTYTDSANTLQISASDATTTTKGVASFATADFSVTAGAVALNGTVIKSITTDTGALTPVSNAVSILGGEGVDVTHTGSTITVSGEDANTTNKGIASFADANFTVTTGAVSAKSITLGSTALSLGSNTVSIAGLDQIDVGNVRIATNIISTVGTATALNIAPVASGNVSITTTGTGDINLTVPSGREITASTLAVSDLTASRLVATGPLGALITDNDLTFDGTNLNLTGVLNVDSIRIDGNTISATTANTDIILAPNGTGTINASTSRITNLGTPTAGTDAATKTYVDTIASAAIHYHDPVRVESPVPLPGLVTYYNGPNNDGEVATLTGTNAVLVIDGITVDLNDRVLVYNQATAAHNGVYYVSQLGVAGTTPWILTRSTDSDSYLPSNSTALGQGDSFFVKEGNTGAGELYVMTTSGTITFGTTPITFSQISSAQIYKAGAGLALTGVTFSAKVDNSSIEINGSDALQVKAAGITNTMLAGSITNDKLVNSTITFTAESGTADPVSLGETITFAAGAGIDTVVSNNTITISGSDASDINKGIASFNGTDFTVTSGNVTLNTERVQDIIFNSIIDGEGIDIFYDDSANTFTISGEDATLTNKGIASFGGWTDSANTTRQFSLTAGDVKVVSLDGGSF